MLAIFAITVMVASPDYDALIDDLAGDSETAVRAHESLLKAGVEAFPALLKRIGDETVISNGKFHGATSTRPRIGRVSFLIIQYQIESAWPKGFRQHYALNEQNVAAWLSKHKGLSITQLRIRALTDSMDSLSREIEKGGVTDFQLMNLSFLHKRLGRIVNDAKKKQ